MKRPHTYRRLSRGAPAGPGPALSVVARSAPVRPRWRVLYATTFVVLAFGVSAHALVTANVIRLVDAVFALAMFAVLAGWVHGNRVALTRLEEPDGGGRRPPVRIVRSRVPPAPERETGKIAGVDADECRVLPHDVR